jgi:hypothetical protein
MGTLAAKASGGAERRFTHFFAFVQRYLRA